MSIKTRSLVVFGDRTAVEVEESAQLSVREDYGRIERLYFNRELFLNEQLPRLNNESSSIHFIVGIANVALKQEVSQLCEQHGWIPVTIQHPTAVVSPSASIGPGTFVAPQAVVSSNAIVGRHSIIHIHASVGHDSVVGDFTSILPGSRISGNCIVGDRTLVGSNAFVAAGMPVGHDSQVDALTYVARNVPDRHILSVRSPRCVPRIDLR